jgi:hypothetical protein
VKAKCSTANFPKLFTFIERSRNTGLSCYNVTPSPRTVAPPPCLLLYIKDSLRIDGNLNDGRMDWKVACKNDTAAAAGCCMSVSLRTETLRENLGQCKYEGQDFKERLKESMEKKKKTWDSVSLRKETLKNRKEARL